eukprot:GHRQ01031175.1.p1 GENE.GHRQ01031175.1~~GHRQ01031175.1.p1  ORF type:complete len:150 (+),score=21.46 GHRQ01031175.1:278-727(+)
MAAQPRQYALALAEGLTGQALSVAGYSPAYDALLAVAPPAALTPEAVAQGHALVSRVLLLGAAAPGKCPSLVAAVVTYPTYSALCKLCNHVSAKRQGRAREAHMLRCCQWGQWFQWQHLHLGLRHKVMHWVLPAVGHGWLGCHSRAGGC